MNWGDKEKVLSIVKLNGIALQYVADKLKDDRDVVITAVQENGGALKFASPRLKNNKEIVIEALKKDKMAFCYIGEKIKEKYFTEEKNYSSIQVNFLLKKPWEKLENNNFLNKSNLEK